MGQLPRLGTSRLPHLGGVGDIRPFWTRPIASAQRVTARSQPDPFALVWYRVAAPCLISDRVGDGMHFGSVKYTPV